MKYALFVTPLIFQDFPTRFVSPRSTVRGSSPSMMAGSRETSSTGPPVCHMLGR